MPGARFSQLIVSPLMSAEHIDGTAVPDGNNDVQWNKRDGLVMYLLNGLNAQI